MRAWLLEVTCTCTLVACSAPNDEGGDIKIVDPNGGSAGTIPTGAGGALVTGGAGGAGGSSGAAAGAGGNAGSVAGSGGNAGGGNAGAPTYDPTFVDGYCVPSGPPLADIPGVRELAPADGPLTMHGGTLYFAGDDEGIYRLTPGATVPELVITGGSTANLELLGANATHVFWAPVSVSTALFVASIASLPATEVEVLPNIDTRGPVWDDSHFYFGPGVALGISRMPFSAAAPGVVPELLHETARNERMALFGDHLYFQGMSGNETIYQRMPLAGGEPELVYAATGIGTFLVADGFMVFRQGSMLNRRALDADPVVPLAMGTLTAPDSDTRRSPLALKLVGDRVYYREVGGNLAWVTLDGTDCQIVAAGAGNPPGTGLTWGLDDQAYYLVDSDSLLAIPRTD